MGKNWPIKLNRESPWHSHFSVAPIFLSIQIHDGSRTRTVEYRVVSRSSGKCRCDLFPFDKDAHTACNDSKIGATERFLGRDAGQLISKPHRTRRMMAGSLFATRGWVGRWEGVEKLKIGQLHCLYCGHQSQPFPSVLPVATRRQAVATGRESVETRAPRYTESQRDGRNSRPGSIAL